MLGVFWKIQEICNQMGTRICKIVEEMSEIIEPKVGNPKNSFSRNWAILSHPWYLSYFQDDIFQHFFTYMVWKYQNEIAPIIYYGISTKTNEKDLKIPKLQPPDWKSPYWMSLYITYSGVTVICTGGLWGLLSRHLQPGHLHLRPAGDRVPRGAYTGRIGPFIIGQFDNI